MRDIQHADENHAGDGEFSDVVSEKSSIGEEEEREQEQEQSRANDLEKAADGTLEGLLSSSREPRNGGHGGPSGASKPGDGGFRRLQTKPKARRETVAWKDLPRKGQLTVLTLARLSEPLVQTSLQVGRSLSALTVRFRDAYFQDAVIHVLPVEVVRPQPTGLCHCQPGRFSQRQLRRSPVPHRHDVGAPRRLTSLWTEDSPDDRAGGHE